MDERWGAQYWMARRSSSTQLRIGNAERERMAEELKEHTHAGRLELHEFEERVERAYRAKTQADLAVLTADLPPLLPAYQGAPAGVRPPRRRGWFHLAARGALSSWLFFSTFMVLIWAMTGFGYFWPIWVIAPWGLMTLRSALLGRPRPGPGPAGRPRHRHRAGWY